jgi:hypothetical protein
MNATQAASCTFTSTLLAVPQLHASHHTRQLHQRTAHQAAAVTNGAAALILLPPLLLCMLLLCLFMCRMEALDNCQLDIMLLYEVVYDEVMKVMFPINSMRNYALLQARTPLVAMVDVDLIVSNALLQWLLDKQK